MTEGPRAARADELAAVVELADTVFGEYRPHDMGHWYPTLFCLENLGHLRVFVDDGKPVALAGCTINRIATPGVSFTAACIGSVVTLKEHRGRGLGTRLMDDCVELAREEGAAILLISGGRGLYRRMGCIDAGEYRTVAIGRGDASRASPPFPGSRVREWQEEDLPHLTALQKREPVRFERSPDQFRAFLGTGNLMDRAGRTWVVESGSGIAAYLSVQDARDEPEGRVIAIQEIGGSRLAILAAVPRLLEQYDAVRVDVRCLRADLEMTTLAAQLGLAVAPSGFRGTARVIDPAAAGSILTGLTRSVLPGRQAASLSFAADAAGLAIRLAGKEHRVEGFEDLTTLLFGSSERPSPLPADGPVRDLLARILPIPLVDYGLNYI
jgi:GNAT superfamily N-acetyltransferase